MTTSEWMDEKLAARWTAADSLKEMLVVPRRISATIVAADRPGSRLVVDIGSGPGDYLAALLDAFPAARGVWTDVSPAMEDIARPELVRYGDRVEFHLVDIEDLSPLPGGADGHHDLPGQPPLRRGHAGPVLRGGGGASRAGRLAGQPRPRALPGGLGTGGCGTPARR